MKVSFILLFILLFTEISYAQQQKAYQIKIVAPNNQVIKGNFTKINDSSLVVVSNATDTSFVNFNDVKKLKVYEKGILLASLLTGGGTVALLSLATGPLKTAFLLIGVPVGLTVGYVVSSIVSTRRRYRNFQSVDPRVAKQELQLYVSN